MHKLRDYPNPGLPVGNPIHALNEGLVLPSSNIERERGGALGSPLIALDSSFDHDDLENLLNSPSANHRDSSPHSEQVLCTPPPLVPSSQEFEYQKNDTDLYAWFRNSPGYEDF